MFRLMGIFVKILFLGLTQPPEAAHLTDSEVFFDARVTRERRPLKM
jgi:hypothetical protein